VTMGVARSLCAGIKFGEAARPVLFAVFLGVATRDWLKPRKLGDFGFGVAEGQSQRLGFEPFTDPQTARTTTASMPVR
jgi:hypothetical protein